MSPGHIEDLRGAALLSMKKIPESLDSDANRVSSSDAVSNGMKTSTYLYPAGRKILLWQDESSREIVGARVGFEPFRKIPLVASRMLFDHLPIVYDKAIAWWERGSRCFIDCSHEGDRSQSSCDSENENFVQSV